MGSGKILKCAIKKHGVENFTKDVLAVFDTPEEMYQMESIVVDAAFVRRDDTYNIKKGGNGGWDHINTTFSYRYENDVEFRTKLLSSAAAGRLHMMSIYPNGTWAGKSHKDSSKQKIGEKNSISQLGIKNSQYGTCWIYNEAGNKKIKKDDLHQYLDAGYIKGRINTNPP